MNHVELTLRAFVLHDMVKRAETNYEIGKAMRTGGLVGAGTGALIGGVGGAALSKEHRIRNALLGALAGGVGGGAVGAYGSGNSAFGAEREKALEEGSSLGGKVDGVAAMTRQLGHGDMADELQQKEHSELDPKMDQLRKMTFLKLLMSDGNASLLNTP